MTSPPGLAKSRIGALRFVRRSPLPDASQAYPVLGNDPGGRSIALRTRSPSNHPPHVYVSLTMRFGVFERQAISATPQFVILSRHSCVLILTFVEGFNFDLVNIIFIYGSRNRQYRPPSPIVRSHHFAWTRQMRSFGATTRRSASGGRPSMYYFIWSIILASW